MPINHDGLIFLTDTTMILENYNFCILQSKQTPPVFTGTLTIDCKTVDYAPKVDVFIVNLSVLWTKSGFSGTLWNPMGFI